MKPMDMRILAMVAVMGLGAELVACGSADADGDLMCSGVMEPDACDRPASIAVATCIQTPDESDPGCVSAACILAREACVVAAIEEAKRCGACWGCDHQIEVRACELTCEAMLEPCVKVADDERGRHACLVAVEACYESSCKLTGPIDSVGC